MAIDTVCKRASSAGCYWPSGAVDRIMALEEYSRAGISGDVPGVPELRRLTMGHRGSLDSIRRTEQHNAIGRTGTRYSIHRR